MGSFSTMSCVSFPVSASGLPGASPRLRKRRISPQAGRALEILGHAIEYLADEFVYAGASLSAHDPQIEAAQLLMSINRQIYLTCPEVPTLTDRLRTLLHLRAA